MIIVLVSVQPTQATHQVAKEIRLTVGLLWNRVISLLMFSVGKHYAISTGKTYVQIPFPSCILIFHPGAK